MNTELLESIKRKQDRVKELDKSLPDLRKNENFKEELNSALIEMAILKREVLDDKKLVGLDKSMLFIIEDACAKAIHSSLSAVRCEKLTVVMSPSAYQKLIYDINSNMIISGLPITPDSKVREINSHYGFVMRLLVSEDVESHEVLLPTIFKP